MSKEVNPLSDIWQPEPLQSVYVMECAGFYKIGFSKNPKSRRSTIQTHNPLDVKLIASIKVHAYKDLEKELHALFSSKRLRGEWFELSYSDLVTLKVDYGLDFYIDINKISDQNDYKYAKEEIAHKRYSNLEVDSATSLFENLFNCTVNSNTNIKYCVVNYGVETTKNAIESLFKQDRSAQYAIGKIKAVSKNINQMQKDPKSYTVMVIRAICNSKYRWQLDSDWIQSLELKYRDIDAEGAKHLVKSMNQQKFYLDCEDFSEKYMQYGN